MKEIKKEIIEALNFYNNENKQAFSITTISKKFKIDKKTLKHYIETNLDIDTLIKFEDNYYLFDETEYKAINEYINTDINFLGIRKKYGYKQETFKKKLKILGYETKRKYKLNYDRNKLKKIKTEEDAYILGFILADGYVHKKSNTLKLKLGERDIDILEKICDYFEMDYGFIKYEFHNITGNKEYYLSIYNKDIIHSLEQYGITQKKSCKEKPFYNIDPTLTRHYIRGIWDGDGFISSTKQMIGVCGSKEVLEYIHTSLINSLDLNFTNQFVGVRYDESSHIYRLNYSGEKAKKILEFLYSGSNIYLDRKYALYKSHVIS